MFIKVYEVEVIIAPFIIWGMKAKLIIRGHNSFIYIKTSVGRHKFLFNLAAE